MVAVVSGQLLNNRSTLENQFGTYWYHTHYSTTNGDGPVGPLIIHSPDEVRMQKYYDFDQVVLMQDWYHDYSQALLPAYLASGSENGEPVPDNGLIQVSRENIPWTISICVEY